MAENEKLDVNFKDLARNATQYVFSSTFPSLERMLKTVKDTSDENKENIEGLNESLDSVSTRIGEVNSGLRKLNDAMAKALGVLGKILKSQESGGGSGVTPGSGLSNVLKAGGIAAGTAGMFSIIEHNNQAPPAPTQDTQQGNQSGQGSQSGQAGASTGATPAGAAPQATQVGGGKTENSKSLVIKASTITFEAGQIVFGGSGGSGGSAGGGGGGGTTSGATKTSSGSQEQNNFPAESGQQSGSGSQGGGGDFESAVVGTSGGLTTLKTRRGKNYQVATSEAKKFYGLVDDLEKSGYQINQIGGYRQSAMWHGKGMAIDINPDQNPMLEKKNGRIINRITGQESSGLKNPKYPFGYGKDNFGSIDVSAMAKKHGLGWGGNWKSSTDTMHFSAGPNEMTEPSAEAVAARGGSGGEKAETQVASASGGAQATPVSKPSATSSQAAGPPEASSDSAPPKDEKKPAAAPAPPPASAVASLNTKGAQLNKESTSSEMASITPPSRASMSQINNVGGGQGGEQGGSIPNPKLANSSNAGNVEPEDAAQRYKSLFGIDPKVPTGQSSRVA